MALQEIFEGNFMVLPEKEGNHIGRLEQNKENITLHHLCSLKILIY